MDMKTLRTVCLLCFLVAFVVTTFVNPPYAAAKPFDNKDAPKTGLGEVFKSRGATGIGPTKAQLFLTFGATIVMIGVLKYL